MDEDTELMEFRKSIRVWIRNNAPTELKGKKILFDTTEIENYESLRAWQRKLYEAGYLGISWPKEYGGYGQDPVKELIAYEEFMNEGLPYGRSLGSIGLIVVAPALLAHGNEKQKSLVKRILSAEDVWCQGFSEPSAGSDLAAISTKAEDAGDHFEVTGQKVWSSYAHIADHCLLLARTGTLEERHRGLTMLIVDMKAPGVTVTPIRQITGKAEFNIIYFNKVKIPKTNVVGGVGNGWKVAMTVLNNERFHVGVTMLFSSEIALRELLKVRGSQELAELAAEVSGARALYERIVEKLRRGKDVGHEGSILKLVTSELLQKIYERAVMEMGPEVLVLERSKDSDPSWIMGFLASRGRTIAAGTSEILRNLIGERLLELPK
ncbi:acyl-CoA dehydrogenase [Sulfodiicoccus acidiphilus]|uniref:Acyl-CoA dehydrogenase n=1 Tax=Sulfodiicoccus acidiphilus TaxID=1670455 RepID=A0A348B101_9CREN|nr:acyl-CoA dehydrogenase family protein [Sulfodiicoccus acidiphilus]BBD71853.1 acyl-CoA dehydrogenase [Sulfodiicoccus acidiphilus]GGU02462.1 acyl-CoA dehydrogenase [Sulfodiicoccus acidiphilus]